MGAMIHGTILWILLHFFTAHIGTQPFCAFDRDMRQWECNYESAQQCFAYNDFCGTLVK